LADLLSPLFGTTDAPGLLGSDPALHLVFFLAVIFAGVFAAEVSFLFGLPVLTLGSDYFGIATLGFTIVVNTLMINSDTILPFPEMKGGRGMIGIPKLTTWFWAFLFLVLVIIIMRNLIHSSTGRAIMSVREDETAAKAMGIDVASNKLLAFVIGSFFAGIGGGVYAHFIGFLSPGTFDFLVGFNPLIIVVFGGLGSMSGSIAASFGWIFFLEGLLRVILGQMGTDAPTWRFVLYPIALLLLMLLRPQGLLGRTEWGFLRAPEAEPRDSGEPRPTPVPTGKETREPTMSGAPTIDHETPTLHITGLTKLFGGLRAVSDFDLTVRRGELAGLIGPNGAGKTTVFNMISGLYLPTAGDIQFQGEGTVGMEPFEITQLGIGRTFQNIRLFPNLSVLDNVRIAYHPHAGYGMFDAILRSRRFDARERELTERAQDFLAIFKLERIQGELAKNLPYGQQRRVEIARALASEPRLLLLDEPAAGMNPAEIVTLMELIHFIRDRFDLTILLIEHQMRVVMGICQHITVMDFGQVIARGTPKEIQGNVRCIEAYLGKGAVSAA
jgi:ABC-type branched-subunit amino acid transport system ATPase component/ABC-type branched-subunit amino acid transport system permease subunit